VYDRTVSPPEDRRGPGHVGVAVAGEGGDVARRLRRGGRREPALEQVPELALQPGVLEDRPRRLVQPVDEVVVLLRHVQRRRVRVALLPPVVLDVRRVVAGGAGPEVRLMPNSISLSASGNRRHSGGVERRPERPRRREVRRGAAPSLAGRKGWCRCEWASPERDQERRAPPARGSGVTANLTAPRWGSKARSAGSGGQLGVVGEQERGLRAPGRLLPVRGQATAVQDDGRRPARASAKHTVPAGNPRSAGYRRSTGLRTSARSAPAQALHGAAS
jgi:hypothetical protein